MTDTSRGTISTRQTAVWIVIAVASFHTAYEIDGLVFLIAVYLYAVVRLGRTASPETSFLAGLLTGFLVVMPQLLFFQNVFPQFAFVLWSILAFWTGLFVLMAHVARFRAAAWVAMCLTPVFWTGLEYFRCECYALRFTWLIPGYTFAGSDGLFLVDLIGVYGVGFLLVAVATIVDRLQDAWVLCVGATLLLALAMLPRLPEPAHAEIAEGPVIVGVQLESPDEEQVIEALDRAVAETPDADLIVLSEYTFPKSIPESVLAWCGKHHRYLIAGGRDFLAGGGRDFFNTAFVVSPAGKIVFQQAKSVPIQFLRDGLAADRQEVWQSPWGKIGICICYDLSYTRVTDGLIERGAQLLIVPTMDVESWGPHEHQLHAKVAPSRAAEYRVPIVRVCSSGISQIVSSDGRVAASMPFPGQGASFSRRVGFVEHGRVHCDRRPAFTAVIVTAVVGAYWIVSLIFSGYLREKTRRECRSARFNERARRMGQTTISPPSAENSAETS